MHSPAIFIHTLLGDRVRYPSKSTVIGVRMYLFYALKKLNVGSVLESAKAKLNKHKNWLYFYVVIRGILVFNLLSDSD